MDIFSRLFSKKENNITYNLSDLIPAKYKLVEAGKNVNEQLNNIDTIDEESKVNITYLLDKHSKIQDDIIKVKKAISEANVLSKNNNNIFEYECHKVKVDMLEKFARLKRKKNRTIFSILKIDVKIKILKRQMEKLRKNMQDINDSYKVELSLVSGII